MAGRFNTDRLRLELSRARTPAIQLLFLLAAAIFAASVTFKNQLYKQPWKSYNTYQVAFDSAKGVVPDHQPVRMAGVNVGIITGTKVVGRHAVVDLAVEKKFGDLYRDAKFRLRPLTPLDDMYVDITSRGHASAGKLTDDDIAPAGQTESPVDISRVLNIFEPDVRQRMQTLLAELGRGLDDNGAQLRRSFAELAPFLVAAKQATDAIAQRHEELAVLVHDFGGVTQALADRDRQLTSLVSSGDQTLAALAGADTSFSETLRRFPPAVSALQSALASLQQTEGALDPAIASLRPVAKELRSGLTDAGKFGHEATPALAALQPAVRDLRPLAHDLRPTADSLAQSFQRLDPQTSDIDAVTSAIPPCFFRIQKFFNNTLSVFKFYDENGAFPRGSTSYAFLGALDKQDPNVRPRPSCVEKGNLLETP